MLIKTIQIKSLEKIPLAWKAWGLNSLKTLLWRQSTGWDIVIISAWFYGFFMVHIQLVLCTKNRSQESTVNTCFPSSSKNLQRACYHSLRSILYGLFYHEKHCFWSLSLTQLWEKTKLSTYRSALRQMSMSIYLGGSRRRRKDLSSYPH